MLRSKTSAVNRSIDKSESSNSLKPSTTSLDELEREPGIPEPGLLTMDRRGSQGLRNILLKGEMRYLKEVNMLVFLCSPL